MFRSMRRPHLALPEDEAWRLLKRASYGLLSVHGMEGYPYAVPMNHAVIDCTLVFHAAAEGHRLDALHNDPRACFTVVEGPEEDLTAIPPGSLGTYSSAVAFGRVTMLPRERQEEMLEAFVCRHLPERAGQASQFLRGGGIVEVLCMKVEYISGKRLLVK